MGVSVRKSGPVFDGRAVKALHDYIDHAEKQVAEAGVQMVQDHLHTVIRNPTGYYESHIRVAERSHLTQVTDDNVVYGPWLEGTGSRNRSTRFKGYATFRKVGQMLQTRSKQIAERSLPRYIRRMN
jgi:hypothetical protein